ncbi:LemA family protein [Candidatus Pacearchaeota archaeon]|nr:LemA family protein [Candidatus Pacearchaeota archaeon]
MAWIIGIAVAVIIVIVISIFIYYYNRFAILENRIENSSSQIDVQLKKRSDLVPNLVKTVKGYAKHEKGIMADVTKARADMLKAGNNLPQRMKAGDMLQNALSKIFAIAENYPDLKANQNFLHLQQELSAIEDKVAYARQYFNDSVLAYDNATSVFPGVWFFHLYKKEKKEYIKIPEAQKAVPNVDFDTA